MKLTNEDVREILRLLDAASYEVLEIQTEQFKLTLRRNREGDWAQETRALGSPSLVKAPLMPPAAVQESAVPVSPPGRESSGLLEVRTSLPGTFYRAPGPGAPPFVEVGTHVEADTVVGIIETMKLMNAVHAGASGEVAQICAQNAQFLEPGALLMRLRADRA